MTHPHRYAGMLRTCAIVALALCGACAHHPRDADPRTWTEAAPSGLAVVASAEKQCRKRLEVGTRIPVTRCLTREEELRERRRATTLLGLVGGGHFRDGS